MSQNSAYFRFRLPAWAQRSHPVYRQETQRHAASRGLAVLQLVYLPILFAVSGLALTGALAVVLPLMLGTMVDGFVETSLTMVLVVLMTIQVGAGALSNVMVIAQTAPAISGEIELQSWRLLRTTTLFLHEIVFAKFTAALMHLRLMLGGLMVVRIITTVSSVLLYMFILMSDISYRTGREALSDLVTFRWLSLMLPVAPVVLAYLAQPLIQFVLNGSLGLLASAYTRSRGQAIAAGLVARLGLWAFAFLTHFAAISGLTSMLENWSRPQYSSFDGFQMLPPPSSDAIALVTSVVIAGYAIAIVAGQVGVALLSLGVALRRARQLGV